MSEKVKLQIRSAVCHDDCKIEANLDWTVLQVKKQIEQDWSTHPPPQDQRLVYAGKLLQDASLLKEVLRLEDLHQAYIVHLVCRQISPPPTAAASPRAHSDGLRRRTVNTTSPAPAPSPANQSVPSTSSTPGPSPWVQPQQFDPSTIQIDQAALMQQMYAQYVNQYMHYLHSAGHFATAGIQSWNHHTVTQIQDPRQVEPAQANNVLQPMALAAAAVAGGQAVAGQQAVPAQPIQHAAQQPNVQAANVGAQAAAGQVGPNPPNVVMNANAGGLGAVEDDEEGGGGQRDILDWFYVASRILVLFSIIYFYSSLARFALVAGVGLVLYLYQIGFFGQPRGAVQQNPVAVQPQPQPEQAQQEMIRQQVDEVREAAGGGAAEDNAADRPQDVAEIAAENASVNYFSLVSTFVTTFFSSLIPQEPQLV